MSMQYAYFKLYKCQLILQSLFGAFNSPKTQTEKFEFTSTMESQVVLFLFVFFLGELKTPKRHFKINWPLQKNKNLTIISALTTSQLLNLYSWVKRTQKKRSLMMGDGDSCWRVEEHFSDKTGKKVLLPEYIKIIPELAPSFLKVS